VRSADDALSENEIYDEENYHACGDEDGGRDGDGDIAGAGAPDDAQDAGGYAGHAETEHGAGHEEFMAAALVQLENRHGGGGAEDEEEEENRGDGDIEGSGGLAAKGGGGGSIGRV